MNEEIYEITTDADGVDCYIKRGEIVRCRDCKHHEELLNNHDGKVLCWVHGIDVVVDRNGYCNYGERKEHSNEHTD